VIFAGLIAAALLAWRLGSTVADLLDRLHPHPTVWRVLGDLLTKTYGGLGMGASWTSALFLCVIVLLVAMAQLNVGNRKAITQ
jgi:uncharacterized membrane-anchored protein